MRHSKRRIAMTRITPIALVALAAALGACGTPPQSAQPTIVTNVHPYKAGNGVVQAVMPVPVLPNAGTSAAGLQRLEIKMDNGAVQYVDTPSREFSRGTRVSLSEDHVIRRM